MRRMNTVLIGSICGLLVVAAAGALFAGSEGRLVATVLDAAGNPLKDVQIQLRATEFAYEKSGKTNKKGQTTLTVLDASRDFRISLQKEGYQTIEEPFKLRVGDTMRRTWTLVEGAEAGGTGLDEGPGELDAGGRVLRVYEAAYQALRAGDYETAVAKFQQVSEMAPELPEPRAGLAMAYLNLDRHDESLAAAQSVLEMEPDNVLALRVQYEVYHDLGDSERKDAVLVRLEELDPGPDTARRMFNSGVPMIQAGQLEEAAKRFERALALDSELAPAYAALAQVYMGLGDVDKAVASGERLVELEPESAEILTLLYVAYRSRGETEKARNAFTALQSGRPDYVGTGFYEKGVSYFNDGDMAGAREIFEGVLETLPDHPKAHYMLALCLFSGGEMNRAKELLTRFLELAPDDPDAPTAREMLATL